MIRTMFTEIERTAIGELVELATMLGEEPMTEAKHMLGALCLERAANIIRGEATPNTVTDEYVIAFTQFWDVGVRATFNAGPHRQKLRRRVQ